MAVPTSVSDLDSTIANNSPSGSDAIGTTLDDYLRAHAGIIKQENTARLSGTETLTNKTLTAAKLDKAQIGVSGTATNNFTMTAEAADGSMKLARGNPGSTTQDVMTVNSSGVVSFPQNTVPAFYTTFTGTSVFATTDTEITTNSKSFDTTSAMSATTGRFTPNVAGYYQINTDLVVSNMGGATTKIHKNGSAIASQAYGVGDEYSYKAGSVSTVVYLNGSTDYVSVFCYAASGNATVTGHLSGFLVART